MKFKKSLICLGLIIFSTVSNAQLRVHHIFDNNMILQRDKPVKVWGWGKPGSEVTVEFNSQFKSTMINEDESWSLHLDPMPANSNPQVLKVTSEGDAVVFQNVLVGDIWILGGQSNMELDLQRIYHGDTEIASANFPNIRILTIPANASPAPMNDFERLNEWDGWLGRYDLKGYWFISSPVTVPTFSGMGYIFGRRLYMATQVPIGLIDASWGGTALEGWVTRDKLLEIPENKGLTDLWDKRIEQDEKKAFDRSSPGASYNGMLNVFAGFAVKGVIFHHGFNNALGDSRPKLYEKNLKILINQWREAFNDPSLPFGIIELSAGGQPQTMDNFAVSMLDAGTYIREAQLNVYKDMENIGFVAAYDQQVNWYHPFKKQELSERLARWALSTQYGYSLGWEPALVTGSEIQGDKIIISFDKEIATHDGRPVEGFALAGKDRYFHPAKADFFVSGKDDKGKDIMDLTKLVVSCKQVKNPVAARYAWARNPLGNLVNNLHSGKIIPVPSFRTDGWDWPEAPFAENNSPEFLKHRELLKEMRKKIEK